jgi:hypothetical protein
MALSGAALKETNEIFERLERKMDAIHRLLHDIQGPDTGQQRHLVSRIAVEGRAVTNILQNLRGKMAVGKAEFDRWYAPFVAEMKIDPLMRFFYELRTSTLKQGDDRAEGICVSPRPGGRVKVTTQGIEQSVSGADGCTKVMFCPAPPNAVCAFIGDSTGGAGWEVRKPDGSITRVYAPLHPDVVEVSAILREPPKTHLGVDLPDAKPTTLCSEYVRYLTNLVGDARRRFLEGDSRGPVTAE